MKFLSLLVAFVAAVAVHGAEDPKECEGMRDDDDDDASITVC